MESNAKPWKNQLQDGEPVWLLVKGVKVKVKFSKILRVCTAGTLRNGVQRIRKW